MAEEPKKSGGLKEDWKKLPTLGKVAVVGGGLFALYFVYQSYINSSAGSPTTAVVPTTSSGTTSSSGTGTTVSSGSGSSSGTQTALDQLAQGQQALGQAMVVLDQQQMAATQQEISAMSTQQQTSTQNELAAFAKQENATLSQISAQNAQQDAALTSQAQANTGALTGLQSLFNQLLQNHGSNYTVTNSNAANTGTASVPSTEYTPPAQEDVTVNNVSTGTPATVPVHTTTTGFSITVPGTSGLHEVSFGGTSAPSSLPAGTVGNVGAGNAGLPAGQHKVAVPVNFHPGENNAPNYRIA